MLCVDSSRLRMSGLSLCDLCLCYSILGSQFSNTYLLTYLLTGKSHGQPRRRRIKQQSCPVAPDSDQHHQDHDSHQRILRRSLAADQHFYYVFVMINPDLTYRNDFWYAPTFAMFFYSSTNPFIYATKFDPVRRILKDIIHCKKTSVQPSDGT